MEIKVTKSTTIGQRPRPKDSELGFGKYLTDHMFLMDYTREAGWHDPRIEPYQSLRLDPAAMVLHYGQEIFEGLKAYHLPDGGIGLFRPDKNIKRMNVSARRMVMPELDPDLSRREALTLLVCENITNIDNIGFLFRNAAAFGVDAVLLSPRCHDPLYRKSLRVSIGHALTVPFVRSTDWTAQLDRLRREWGVTLIAAALDPRAEDLDAVARPGRVGLVVGQEFEGISPETLDRCDHIVRIPMAPGVDSLNVAVAAAVCLHRFSTGQRS